MDFKTYLEHPGLSQSSLKMILKSVSKYRYYKDNPSTGQTPAMLFGSALHTAVLEPELFNQEYIYEPDYDKRKNAGDWKEFKQNAYESNRIILPAKFQTDIEGIKESLKQHSLINDILNNLYMETEKSIFWNENGLDFKARIDIFIKNETEKSIIIGDLKTCLDLIKFEKDISSYGYYIQDNHYTNAVIKGLKLTDYKINFLFLAVEKQPPYDCDIFYLDNDFSDIAEYNINKAIEKYKNCAHSGIWKENEKIKIVYVPNWLIN